MTLPPATRRRLQKLPQVPNVWEGDRRPIPMRQAPWSDDDLEPSASCILWVDASTELVRAMEIMPGEVGQEAMVRTLIQGMEHPHPPAQPARPLKIRVQDRETQFFLRGALQDLGITVDYTPTLPLIDDLFERFQAFSQKSPSLLPIPYSDLLAHQAATFWNDAIWEVLSDHHILKIELNRFEIDALYACVMGMIGMEYGIILYRSSDSLRQFRQLVIEVDGEDEPERLAEAFLQQDCLFITYEEDEDEEDGEERLFSPSQKSKSKAILPKKSTLVPTFGSIHPLEGMRPTLDEDEAIALIVTLEAIHQFWQEHQETLDEQADLDEFPELTGQYDIPLPLEESGDSSPAGTVTVTVSTLPDLAEELLNLEGEDEENDQPGLPAIMDDLVPEGAICSLAGISWDLLRSLRILTLDPLKYYQPGPESFPEEGEQYPIILLQTSRPKAQTLIQAIYQAGGLKGILFCPGIDPFRDQTLDIGILYLADGSFQLFGEFTASSATHKNARHKWDQRTAATKGNCALVVAMGITGASRGNPPPKDMMGLFETRALSPSDLGLSSLRLQSFPSFPGW